MRLAYMNLLLFAGNHCQRESTLTIVTSECSRPLSGVTLYSRNYMTIVSSSNGRYRIRACSLPLYVTLMKYGYRTMRVIVRRSTEKFTMRCLGMFYHSNVVRLHLVVAFVITWYWVDWLQSLKQFFINVSFHIFVTSPTLMALF